MARPRAARVVTADGDGVVHLDDLPMAVVRCTASGVHVNRAAAELVGVEPDEVHTLTDWCERVYGGEAAVAASLLSRPLAIGGSAAHTHEIRRRDGERRVIDIVRTRRETGDELWLLADVTERSLNELARTRLMHELRRASRQFESTFDAIADPIVVLDASGLVVNVNREARSQLRCTVEDAVGRPLAELSSTTPWKEIHALVAAETELEREVVDADAHRAWLVTSRRVESDGAPPRIVVVARDVSAAVALQRVEGEQQALATMGALVGGVAHEVRNPLFGISAMLDLFEAELGGNPEFAQYVAALRTQVERLSLLMQELLEYGRPVRSVPLPAPPWEVVEDAVAATHLLAARLGVRIANDVDAELPPVPIDRLRLAQALRNLLENACQHAPPGSAVRVAARMLTDRGRETLELVVEDEGPGFRTSDLGRLFEPFFTRRRGGTGLGLAIVKRIVVEHRGEITAANRATPGGGASVSIRLPVGPPRSVPPSA